MTVKQKAEVRTQKGTNYSVIHAGSFSNLTDYELEVPVLDRTVRGKLFIRELLDMTSMQISMNKLPAGRAVPFYHKHKENEEAYIFIAGTGQMQVDGETFDVEEGTIARVSTPGNRTLRSNPDKDLYYICIQAKEGSLNRDTFEDGVPDSIPVIWPE